MAGDFILMLKKSNVKPVRSNVNINQTIIRLSDNRAFSNELFEIPKSYLFSIVRKEPTHIGGGCLALVLDNFGMLEARSH